MGNSIARREHNTTAPGENSPPEGKLRNTDHLGLDLPSDHKISTGHKKTFDPLNRIEFIKDVLISNVCRVLQVRKSMLPFDPTIILQGVPNDLMRFVNGPLGHTKNQIVPLTPDGLGEPASQEE